MKLFAFVLTLSILAVFPAVDSFSAPTEPQDTMTAPSRFGFADVGRRAELLAKQPFQEDEQNLPDFFRNLGYDQYQDIRFSAEEAIWRDEGLPFVVQLFHRGFLFLKRVEVNIVDHGKVKPVAYSPRLFSYGLLKDYPEFPKDLPDNLGFAGLKLFFPLMEDKIYNEVAVFLGASYFRAVGRNQSYGLSARGLAIDTGLPKGEEFPFFREFWIEKPDKDATSLILYALLDSPSVTGAYRFVLKPGAETLIDVKTRLFFRKPVEKLGIAPLTSMFLHGENTERWMDDFRPEVHDSDGLSVAAGSGEWLWRPLSNPLTLRFHTFADVNPKRFGLLQRDRLFENYQDLGALYHQRPSVWLEPLDKWGDGKIELVEIPTNGEFNDNIVAFWVPQKPIEEGEERQFTYRLHFALGKEERFPDGRILATRVGKGGTALDQKTRKFVIDFGGKSFEKLKENIVVEAVVSASPGKILNPVTQKNPFTDGWRVFFELEPEDHDSIELRCFLKSGADVLTETWSYQWVRN
ncbi:MAG: glucan biosynthesis protein D [Beggiatoa sp. IS2]|nr:MAG: glucan biosynthesis protein D [Beggiatoa sp. IS2]